LYASQLVFTRVSRSECLAFQPSSSCARDEDAVSFAGSPGVLLTKSEYFKELQILLSKNDSDVEIADESWKTLI
jgi:hypothetical protein